MIDTLWQINPTFQLNMEAGEELDAPTYSVSGSTAIVSIIGPTSKYGVPNTLSTQKVRENLRAAAADPEVDSILLYIDSPGGQVAGNHELVRDVREINKTKPIVAYADDQMASAAYAVAAQAETVIANENAMVGSIGTMSAMVDTSGMASSMGLKVHPLTTGGMKGAGMFGVEVTPEQVGYAQSLLDKVNDKFIDTVATGRNMDRNQVKQLADGRVHLAADAVQLGLVDKVGSIELAISETQNLSENRNSAMHSPMYSSGAGVDPALLASPVGETTEQQAPAQAAPPAAVEQQPEAPPAPPISQAASITEIEAACPNAPAEFVLGQLKADATVADAQSAYIVLLTEQLNAKPEATEPEPQPEAPAPAPAAEPEQAAPMPGVDPIPEPEDEQSSGGSMSEQWENAIANAKADLMNQAAINGQAIQPFELHRNAVLKANKDNPGLREAYLASQNPVPVKAPLPGK